VYDADGNVVTKMDGNGQQIAYAYDDLNRLVTETWVGTSEVIQYAYDKDGNKTSAKDQASALTYTYNARGLVTTVDNAGTPSTPDVLLIYTYDQAGNVLSTADAVNGVAEGLNSYTYNADNLETQAIQAGAALQTKRVDLAYNPLGVFTSIDRYSDAAGTQLVAGSTYTYDILNRLTGLIDSQGTTSLASYAPTYNLNSLITNVVNSDGTTNYTYDSLGELTGAAYSNPAIPTESYTYDSNGNRLTSGASTTYQIGTNNELLSDGTYDYQYDNDANLVLRTAIADGSTESYAYDARGRLVAVIDKNPVGQQTQEIAYTYDGFNRRISESVMTAAGTTVTYFVYDGDNVLLEFQSTGNSQQPVLTEHNLFGPAVDQILAQDGGPGKVSWLLADYLGSIRDVVNNKGTKSDHLLYDSYGDLMEETNPTVNVRYRFAGREFDAATGLYCYRARYYEPSDGRFITEDPTGIRIGSSNRYAYVNNNPVDNTDSTGLQGVSGFPSFVVVPGSGGTAQFAGNSSSNVLAIPGIPHKNLEECLEECEEDLEEDLERCRKLKCPQERAKCYEKAYEDYASCVSRCNQQYR
jgi:RHS repeat-associated protein